MDFYAVLDQVVALLRTRGRVTYRALKLQFQLDDEHLEALKEELIEAQRVAADEDGKVLVWTGDTSVVSGQLPVASPQLPASSPQPPDARLQTLDARPTAAERRQLTVMFCDLVGSTALSAQLDPEDLREVVQAYQATAAEVITRFEGHIAQYLGDGLLVYFGYPRAHEDDARRAVQAGLEIVTALQHLPRVGHEVPSPLAGEGQGEGAKVSAVATLTPHPSLPPQGEKEKTHLTHRLQVRIGVHTGLVVVGEIGSGGRHEQLALGETPNIAARLQGLAAPDTVVISAVTARLVQNAFALEELGTQQLKGVTEPLAVARVLGLREPQSVEEDTPRAGVPFLVGRDEEVGLLRRRWEQSKEGLGQVVLITGEPGIGKTALVETLRTEVRREGATRVTFRCSPYHQNSALYPVIEHLQHVLQFERDDLSAARLEKLERVLAVYRFPLAETVPLFAALLSVSVPEGRYPALDLTPQQQKQQTHDALAAWLVAETERQTVLAVWEDVQWADPSTLEWLGLVIDQTPTVRMLTVLTFRPDFLPPWPPRSHMTPLTLNRLERPQVEAIVRHLAEGKALPAEVMQQIVAKTDGVPLFVEELTKMVLESGLLREAEGHYELTGPLPPLAIPTTLQDSLMARLDRLATVKEVAQLGATLGREFSYELLKAVSPLDEAVLQKELGRLVEAELLYQRGLPPQSRYIFKHALIQDAAYQSLLKSKRQQYHQQIAQVLEERFPETRETQPELLAHHYTEAGLRGQAIPYWQKAGERATQRSANVEAIGHLTKGLELLKTLPDTPERIQQELTLQIALGNALIATKGFAAPEVERVYARARELCQQVGETPHLFPVLEGLTAFYDIRAELRTAHELGEQLLSLAQSVQDPALLLAAHHELGFSWFQLGELASAQTCLEQGIALYDPQKHRSLAFLYVGHDPGVCCRDFAALALWLLGYPDQALKKSHEALTLARELSHPFSLAEALGYTVRLHEFRREGQVVQERAEAVIALSTKQGFPFWLAQGTILRGWALAEQGQEEKGIAQMCQGLSAYRATGAELYRPYFLALLAEVYGKGGQAEDGLRVLAEALAAVDKTGERWFEAELYRLKGELLLRMGEWEKGRMGDNEKVAHSPTPPPTHSSPEACFQQAIDIARRQSAKSLELRATTSLARLWQQQGKTKEAHEMLAEIYGWFTEGFDTKDLQEAKVLLEELGH